MVVKEEQERVRTLLCDTITLLCRNGLTYKNEFNISAVIGITLDKEEVMLVDIRETIKNTADEAEEPPVESEERSRKRRKLRDESSHKLRDESSQNSNEDISLADKTFEQVDLKREHSEDDADDIVFIKDEPRDSLESSSVELSEIAHQYSNLQHNQSFPSQYTMPGASAPMAGTSNMSWDQSQQQQQQQASISSPGPSATVPQNQVGKIGNWGEVCCTVMLNGTDARIYRLTNLILLLSFTTIILAFNSYI